MVTIIKIFQQTWWEKANTPFKGDIFKMFNLRSDDQEELRIQKIRERLLNYDEGKISVERARLVTESYKNTEGEHPVIRKAKAFHHVMSNITIECLPEELIVGNPNSGFGKVEIDPEYMADWLENKVELGGKIITELRALRMRKHNRLLTDDKVIEILENEIFPYWKGRTLMAIVKKELITNYPELIDNIEHTQLATPVWGKGFRHTIQD